MTARDDLRKYVNLLADSWTPRETTEERVDWLYGTVRAEVLAEVETKAREVVARLWGSGLTQQHLDRAAGARAVEWEIGLLAAGKDTREGESTQPSAEPHDHQYKDFGPHAGQRCITCNRPWYLDGSGEITTLQPAPDFFRPDHTYTRFDGTTFQCATVTTHPSSGVRLAIGWLTDTAGWTFLAHHGLGQWLHEYGGGKSPATGTNGEATRA